MIFMSPNLNKKICVVGLGYVGLPLAIASSREYETIGYDRNEKRISELQDGKDSTLEVENSVIKNANKLKFTARISDAVPAEIYILAVPTPINEKMEPDLSLLMEACEAVGTVMSKGNIVIVESTVSPGTTEGVCAEILSSVSGLCMNVDFFMGYSPERINPGDKNRGISDIVKVTSGSTIETAAIVDEFYSSVINAGTYRAPSIRVAEAAKIIENVQRDLNIALMNEFAQMLHLMNISSKEVLDAARTKWNFLDFGPGLVGGHCIGVDPYYLLSHAQKLGFDSQLILAARNVNESVPDFVVSQIEELFGLEKELSIGFLGLSFKENCADYRNSKAIVLAKKLSLTNSLKAFDPYLDKGTIEEVGLNFERLEKLIDLDLLIVAVAHDEFKKLSPTDLSSHVKDGGYVFDIKSVWNISEFEGNVGYWSL